MFATEGDDDPAEADDDDGTDPDAHAVALLRSNLGAEVVAVVPVEPGSASAVPEHRCKECGAPADAPAPGERASWCDAHEPF